MLGHLEGFPGAVWLSDVLAEIDAAEPEVAALRARVAELEAELAPVRLARRVSDLRAHGCDGAADELEERGCCGENETGSGEHGEECEECEEGS